MTRSLVRRACIRVAQVAVAGVIVVSAAACTCPPPNQVDQTFVLGATDGTPINLVDAGFYRMSDAGGDAMSSGDAASTGDAMSSGDAAPGDGVSSIFHGAPPDAQAPTRDCTSAADGCAPGQACPAACACVLDRAGIYQGTVERCTLLDGPGPRQVRVHYQVPVFCPGD